jgi:hypothetical protein
MSSFDPKLPFHVLSSLQEVKSCAPKELVRVTDWMKEKSVLLATRLEKETKEKTLGPHIQLIAGCPHSKPFWVDNNQDLECIACKFSQREIKSWEHPEKLPWMTK